ncbi:MAG TPA: hypothetical protein VJL58_04090 [Pyrinomonadaceae bacterium]|nr:hypothetical protein [Pyrinomonadaceae bacterium]
MNFIKVILAILGIIFGFMILSWLLGMVWGLLGWALWIGVIAAIGYGGYKLFTKIESRVLGSGNASELPDSRDFNMTWEEYDRKYLKK